jgi:hypothetical protein
MGVKFVDGCTKWHFFYGLLCSLAGVDIYISNFIHLLIEINERTHRDGKLVESTRNHVGDVIAFLSGTLLTQHVEVASQNLKYFFLFVILLEATQEIVREL